ncbi:cation diffusion facilitator family transporter [Fusobacterium sp. HMSC064B11]|uniref:AI-2E family transporter n=1 Tax=Fusobacterium sp. HMSC064B11 TaxID=1739543 RepID=UPI0008A14C48|nr:cation diffusion facilitator family transporter [Fusobacterium sp. HMSC064B11]OFO30166.1 cation diffusion facilitator family transporter [Fusobacterium sp. HMSC064B11]
MKNENAILNVEELNDLDENLFYLDELEEELQEQLDFEISEFDFLKKEKEKIGSPEALGETIKGVIWDQFINQVSNIAGEEFIKENGGMPLDLSDEAHIQTTENFENGKIATHNYISKENLEYNYDRYKNKPHSEFRENYVDKGMDKVLKRAGELNKNGTETVIDIYTGRKISTMTKLENGKNNPEAAQREHVIASAELYKNPSLQMANSDEELAAIINDPENLQGYTTAKRNNRKSDNSADEMEEQDKTEHWKKANKKAEDFVNKKEKEGEERLKEEGRKTQKEEAFRIGGKALKSAIMTLLVTLLKNIIGKLVKWFRTAKRSFNTLVEHIKEAFTSFLDGINSHLINSAMGVFNTVAMSIFNPISRIFKNFWTILKQGWRSLKEAFNYIKNPENRKKPIGVLLFEIGKIIIAGVSAVGAVLLGEIIEIILSGIPFLAIEIPLLGSLANIIGIFMGASISGVIGAIAINYIQKKLEKKLKSETTIKQIEKGNEILLTQAKIQEVSEKKLVNKKIKTAFDIKSRHEKFSEYIEENEKDIEEKEKALKSELEEYTKTANKNLDGYIEKNSIIVTDEEIEKQKKKDEEFDEIDSLLNGLFD